VLPEVDWWVTKYLGVNVELAILRDVADRKVRLEGLTPADLERCIDLISEYADSKLGLVDASIAALAERLSITRIFTLDRRHFSMLRPRHCDHFEIVP
jgi:predicted nucleic acid-binding protein